MRTSMNLRLLNALQLPAFAETELSPDPQEATRIYTIWPANRDGLPAASSGPWHQERRWFVLDATDGLAAAHIVEGPVLHPEARSREAELRVVARTRPGARARAHARKRAV